MQSMTGIGEGALNRDGFSIHVIIKSVNHRFLMIQIRLPHSLAILEDFLRPLISTSISRGKIDVNVLIYNSPENARKFYLNMGAAQDLLLSATQLSETLGIPHGFDAEKMLRYPEIVSEIVPDDALLRIKMLVGEAVSDALTNLTGSRRKEGENLKNDFYLRIQLIRESLKNIDEFVDRQVTNLKEKLHANLKKLMNGMEFDAARLDQEIALAVVKSDITEEIVRIGLHLTRFESALTDGKPIGKLGEFIIQELHREANTIGSKSSDPDISRNVVDIKVEIEKMREQIQNIE